MRIYAGLIHVHAAQNDWDRFFQTPRNILQPFHKVGQLASSAFGQRGTFLRDQEQLLHLYIMQFQDNIFVSGIDIGRKLESYIYEASMR